VAQPKLHIQSEMAVRTFNPAVGTLVVLVLLVFCADSEAGRFCRQRCGNSCCGIPCWVRWHDVNDRATACISMPGYDCYCCPSGGGPAINCNFSTNGCETNTICCVLHGSGFVPNCGGYGGRGCACLGCSTCHVRLYAMVCDPCFHVLRFALPWECPLVYGPLRMLGSHCTLPCSN
jgi:hypothetical protein